jgi:hypothetical protein
MTDANRRVEARFVRGLALTLWLVGWALVAIGIAEAALWARGLFGGGGGVRYSLVDTISNWVAPVYILVELLVRAALLFAAARGVVWLYEAVVHLRRLAPVDGYEETLGPADLPGAVARGAVWICRALVRFWRSRWSVEGEE